MKARGGRWENSTLNDRDLFSLSPSHRAPRALYFFLPSPPTTQRGLSGGERVGHYQPQTKNKRFKPLKIVWISENK